MGWYTSLGVGVCLMTPSIRNGMLLNVIQSGTCRAFMNTVLNTRVP
jgi:hypothetical protein